MEKYLAKSNPKKMDVSMNALVEIGARGHFPLFPSQWIHAIFSHPNATEGESDVEKTLHAICHYPSLDKKKVLLSAMKEKEREQFIRFFFKLVESKILDQKLLIQ